MREGAVIPVGGRDDRPDHDYLAGLTLHVFPGPDGARDVTVTDARTAEATTYRVERRGGFVEVTPPAGVPEPRVVLRGTQES
ncbi:hypothetical protein MAFF212519_15590 [Clavibacter michiganensis]